MLFCVCTGLHWVLQWELAVILDFGLSGFLLPKVAKFDYLGLNVGEV